MEQRIASLEEEVNLIKNQIRAVLLDIKEYLSGSDWPVNPGIKTVNSLFEDEDLQPEIEEKSILNGETRPSTDTVSIPADTVTNNGEERNCSQAVLSPPTGSSVMDGKETQNNNHHRQSENNNGKYPGQHFHGMQIDTLTLVMFIQWLERCQNALGREETGRLLEIYASSQNLPEEYRQTLRLLLELFQGDKDTAVKAAAIPYLMELDDLFHPQHHPGPLQEMALKMMLQHQHSMANK
jgi:hypothetical protein